MAVTETESKTLPYTYFNRLIGRYRRRFDLDLGRLNIIAGPNLSYKTTIIQNYRLGLNGVVPGVETNLAAQLSKQAVVPGSAFTNELQSADGISTFNCPATGKTALQPLTGRLAQIESYRKEFVISDSIAPLFSPKSPVGRETFVRAFGARLPFEAPDGMTTEQEEIWKRGVETLKQPKLTAAHVADVTEWLRAELNRAGTLVSTAESKLAGARELTRSATSTASAAEIAELREALSQSERWAAYQNYIEAEHILARAESVVKLERARTIREWVVLSQAVDAKAPKVAHKLCPLCRSQITEDRIKTILQSLDKVVAQRTEEVQGLTSYVIQQATQTKATAASVLGDVNDVPVQPTHNFGSIADIRAKLMSLTRVGSNSTVSLAKLTADVAAAKNYYTNVQTLKASAAALGERITGQLIPLAHDYMADRMDGLEPHLALGAANVEWGVIGKHRGVSTFAQLSGRERALLITAGAQILSKSPLKIFIMDDIELGVFDATNIVSFARTLAAAAERGDLTQVFLIWNRLPELVHLANEGWMIFDTTNMSGG